MITINQISEILNSKNGGKPLSKIPNFYSLIYQAIVETRSAVDLPSSIRTVQLSNPIYSDIQRYPLPDDFSLGAIINLRPIIQNTEYYDFDRLNPRQYNIENKYSNIKYRYATKSIDGIEYLLFDADVSTPKNINNCDSLTSNGSVGAIGATTNIEIDTLQKITGSGAISFDVGLGASNGVEIIGMSSVDISDMKDLFIYINIPNKTNLNGVKISVGQSSSDYFSGSTSIDFFGNSLSVGVNLIRIPISSLSITTGSPNLTDITYFRCEIIGTYSNIVSGFKLDSITAQIGSLYEIDYYSNYQFKTVSGARIQIPTSDSDIALLNDDELSIFLGKLIEIMSADLKQQTSAIDISQYGGTKLEKKIEDFKIKFPSLRQLPKTKYGYIPNIN